MINYNLQKEVIDTIKNSQGATIQSIVRDLIKANNTDKLKMEKLWSEYTGKAKILTSIDNYNTPARPDNRLAHDFPTVIIQQCVSYLLGNAIEVSLSEDGTNNYEAAEELLSKFLKLNFSEKLDAELGTYTGVCGKAFRLIFFAEKIDYLGKKSLELIMKNIKPWEGLIIQDSTVDEVIAGMIYYPIEIINGTLKKFRNKVEFYDSKNVYYLIEDDGGNYKYDDSYGEAIQPHGFSFVPVVKFSNNTLEMGDFEKVRTLIDAYDKAVSFGLNDYESYSMAYLIYHGVRPTEDELTKARLTKAFYIPIEDDLDVNNKIEFLTKEVNTQNLKDFVKMLNDDIFRFSAALDYTDESFGGNQSGESRKYKLIPLEQKAKDKERWFVYGFQQLYKVVTSFWAKTKSIQIDPEEIAFTFTRNLPLDVTITDLISLQQAGILSTETAIDMLPFIEDSVDEYEKVSGEYSNNLKHQLIIPVNTDVTGSVEAI